MNERFDYFYNNKCFVIVDNKTSETYLINEKEIKYLIMLLNDFDKRLKKCSEWLYLQANKIDELKKEMI